MGFKMSCRLGLRIGESFAELRGQSDSSSSKSLVKILAKRWYLPKKTLADGLKEVFEELGEQADSGLLQIVTSRMDQTISRQQGHSPALFVTAGFESWLKIQQPSQNTDFALTPARSKLPLPDDQIFGINERVGADGSEISPIQPEELEFLVSKLELLKVRHIAVGFLHSDLNPEHENQVAQFFRERGFSVTTSHSFSDLAPEAARWRAAIECAYSESSAEEEMRLIEDVLKAVLGERRAAWDVRVWTPNGPSEWTEKSLSSTRGGANKALAEWTKSLKSPVTIHFGLESFLAFVQNDKGQEPRVVPLPVQPTRRIELGPWSVPTLGSEDRGYEPGPMLFGKSHALTVLDVFYALDRLKDIEAFTPLVSERTKPRILEALYTLGKMIPTRASRGTIDAKDVAEDLETYFVERIAGSLARFGSKGEITLTGPLAPTFFPLLKKRRPDLSFTCEADSVWAGADSCLAALGERTLK